VIPAPRLAACAGACILACLAWDFEARAQGLRSCAVEDNESARDGKGPDPIRGSTFLFDQSLSTQAAHVEPTPQQSYVPFYGWWLSLRPCWHFNDKLRLQGRFDYYKEFTNNQQTTLYREDVFGDIWTDLVYQTPLAADEPWKNTEVSLGLRALWPTSKQSQGAGTYVTLGALAGVSQTLPIFGDGSRFLEDAWVGLRLRYLHPFTNATTPTSYGNFSYVRQNVDGFSFVSDQLQGQTTVNHELWAILDAGLQITPRLDLAFSLVWIDQWHYPPPAASVDTLTGPVSVPRNGDQQFTQLLWDTIAIDYDLFDEVQLGLGYYNLTNSIGPDGRSRSPFTAGQDNVFWSPDARIFFDVSANLDRIYEDAVGRHKFGESSLGRTASARGQAGTAPTSERQR
jgi:hypothetical protein